MSELCKAAIFLSSFSLLLLLLLILLLVPLREIKFADTAVFVLARD